MPHATNPPSVRQSNATTKSFRVGQVKAYLRGRVRYLQYHERGARRVGAGVLRVRNKPRLGWRVKTRSEREVLLVTALVDVLRVAIGGRTTGPAFRQPRCGPEGHVP